MLSLKHLIISLSLNQRYLLQGVSDDMYFTCVHLR